MGEVIDLPVVTRLDMNPDKVLEGAKGELEQVIVIGYDKEGEEYFASSIAGGPECLWLMERFKASLLAITEEE